MDLHVDDSGPLGLDPVLLCHGLGSELEAWRSQLAFLRRTRRTIAFDQRGHGRSPRAPSYNLAGLLTDLERLVADLGLPRFWLVGHSFSGLLVSMYAGAHPEKLAGVIYVDAVGDVSPTPREVIASFQARDADMTPEKLLTAYGEMLGPLARPKTREKVLESVARMDHKAYSALRGQMASVPAASLLARFSGPKRAIDAAGPDNPVMAHHLDGVQRQVLDGVSHWLMLDDPEATNAALAVALKP